MLLGSSHGLGHVSKRQQAPVSAWRSLLSQTRLQFEKNAKNQICAHCFFSFIILPLWSMSFCVVSGFSTCRWDISTACMPLASVVLWVFLNCCGSGLGLCLNWLCFDGSYCRRGMWNFFRLENEHLNNCGEFRAIRMSIFLDCNHCLFGFFFKKKPL